MKILCLAALPLISLPLVCGCSESTHDKNSATSVQIYSSNIITMSRALPRAEAVAVENGRIVAVGSLEEVQAQFTGNVGPVNRRFSNKVLLPGLIDNHLHPSMAAVILPMAFITPFDWNLADRDVVGVLGQDAYRQRLRDVEGSMANPDEWVFTWGYHPYFHGRLSREDLDAISTTRPIVVWHRSFHEIVVNTVARDAMGVTEANVAGHPHIDFTNGHFFETGLQLAVARLGEQLLAPEKFMAGLSLTKNTIHRGGITTIVDMAAGLFDLELEWSAMKAVLDTDDTPFRTLLIPSAMAFGDRPGDAKGLEEISNLPERNTDKLFFVKQIKLFADGAFYSQLMQMNEPGYLDGHHGAWLMQPDELEFAARAFWNAGYQIHVHSNGDHGTDVALDILQRLQDEQPREDHRFTLHHLGYSTEDQSLRMADLGALVSANPYYLYALGDKYSEIGLGPERASQIFRGGSLIDAGVPLSLHSDFTMAPAAPLTLAWVAANRIAASGKVLAPDLKLGLDDALRAVTIEAAYAIRMEEEIGSIEIGKKADFTVLEQDPYAVPVESLRDIEIWGTVFEGTVYPLDAN